MSAKIRNRLGGNCQWPVSMFETNVIEANGILCRNFRSALYQTYHKINVYYYSNGTRDVKLKSITIKNLRSFENSEFSFEEYNVIVGPNNSGKTNLLRILKMLASNEFLNLRIMREIKFEQGKKSLVKLTVETTDLETKMILQALMHKNIESEKIPKSWKQLTIILRWPDLGDDAAPDNVTFYFQNGVAVTFHFAGHMIFYCPSFNIENPKQFLDEMCSLKYDEITNKIKSIGVIKKIHDELHVVQMAGKELSGFFGNGVKSKIIALAVDYAAHNPHERPNYVLELTEYVGLRLTQGAVITPLVLVHKMMRNSLIPVEEMHPDYRQLTEQLFKLKSEDEHVYTALKKSFEEIFNGTEIMVEQSKTNDKERTIQITENEKRFKIEDSASGYLETIYILYKVLNNADCIIFLDEPEIHFHPIKIKQIGHVLLRLTEDSHNQIIIISHSPKLVDFRLLAPDYPSALFVVAKNNAASLVSSPRRLDIKLGPHLFEPDVFFGNAIFLVEGPGDKFVIRAISDKFDGFLDRYGIVVVSCGGVSGIGPYIQLLKAYSLVYYGLADKEYDGGDSKITKLDDKLETELQAIIPEVKKYFTAEGKIKPEIAYCVVTDLLETKDGFAKLKKTKIWKGIENVISGQKIDEAFDETYDQEHPSLS